MSSNFNQAKVINVYYNKGDRKPYDITGKPIAYIGEEGIGATEATTIRFYLGEDIDSSTAVIVTKRPDGERRLDICEKFLTGANSYYQVTLNSWYSAVKGKATLAFKVYEAGSVVYNEDETEILSANGRIIVSDIFNLEIRYAPDATLQVPPDDPDPMTNWFFALSTKLDKADSITVAGALPDPLTGYDDRYFYIENEGEGKLYYIDGSTAEEVVWGIGTLKLTATGNGNVTTDTGKLSWQQENGTVKLGLYNDVNVGIGEDVFYYVKAQGAITKGDVIQYAGYQGDHALAKRAVQSEVNNNPEIIMGIAKEDIANGDFGYVAHFGKIENVDTKGVAVNSFVWFDSAGSTAGNWTITKPAKPNVAILLAVIIKAESSGPANNGVMLVRPSITNINIEDIRNIELTSTANGDVLRYNTSLGHWQDTADLTNAEQNITEILNGTQIVGKAVSDQNGNVINTTYLTTASASSTYIPLSSKGQPNGVAPLGPDNKILSIHLPGGVDDIKEFADLASFPLVGEASIIYVALDTNKIYRWGGTAYVEISSSLALGQTNTTAFPGDRGLATETKTDNIVSGVQGLTDTRITNSAVGTSPLIINAVASTTARLQEWQLNGVFRAGLDDNGIFRVGMVANSSSANNSNIEFLTTGTKITRNQADANPSLIVNQANAGSTGDILRLQSAGANKLEITKDGFINQNGTRLFSQPNNNTNTFFGAFSGNLNASNEFNSGFGFEVMQILTSGRANVAVGSFALNTLTSGQSNVAIGINSGIKISTGSNNSFFGRDAGNNASQLETASNSTGLGYQAYTDKSNQMVFGNSSVSEFVFNRNTGALVLMPQTQISSASANLLERNLTTTSTSARVANIRITTSGDMVDGFGGGFAFQIKDNANVDNDIAQVFALRSGADNSGRLRFDTNNAGTMAERMTIMPDGKVGIGTSGPAQLLTVVSQTNTDGIQIRRNSVSNNDYATLGFRNSTADGGNQAEIRAVRTNRAVSGDTDFRFITLSNTAGVEAMRLRDDGLVGINETTISAQLQVKSGATTRVPLIVDTIASNTADLQIWRNEGSQVAFVNRFGSFRGLSLDNLSSSNNSRVFLDNNGTTISRNINDSNPALIVNLANASATANIQVWQKAGVAQSFINNSGVFVGQTRSSSEEQTTDFTLATADEGKVIRVNSSSNRTVTIPLNSGTAIPVGAEVAIIRMGTGTVSISPTAGVTLNSYLNNRKIAGQYSSVALKKIATDEWVLVGSLEA